MNQPQPLSDVDRRDAARPLCVVVADDERDIVDTLAVLLRDSGHTVHSVYSGKDVLPTVRLVRPDALIVDIAIRGMSGYAVAQEIRHTFTEQRRPLLIGISGLWNEHPDKVIARQVGFDHYLDKPCDPNEVLSLLAQPRR
jgi:DNA-binding response OmpR family regulator